MAKPVLLALGVLALAGCLDDEPQALPEWDYVLGPGCPVNEGPPPMPGQSMEEYYEIYPHWAAVMFWGRSIELEAGAAASVNVSVWVCPDEQERTIPITCTPQDSFEGVPTTMEVECPASLTVPGGEDEADLRVHVSLPHDHPDGQWHVELDAPGYPLQSFGDGVHVIVPHL